MKWVGQESQSSYLIMRAASLCRSKNFFVLRLSRGQTRVFSHWQAPSHDGLCAAYANEIKSLQAAHKLRRKNLRSCHPAGAVGPKRPMACRANLCRIS
jgi:hypothetical protein